jgi:prepilin-type processing-associated H-X9-DG protein
VAFGRWHGEIDRHLAESGLPHTLVLPSGFMQNFLASAQYVADQGVLYAMTGETRVSYIDTRDVAAVAARVLTSPGHQGKAYPLTGPEALSGDEVAERLSAATGNQVGSVDVPPDTFGQALAGAGLPGWLVELNIMMADGHAAGFTDEVARLTGRQPRTFAEFAAEYRAIFGGQQ